MNYADLFTRRFLAPGIVIIGLIVVGIPGAYKLGYSRGHMVGYRLASGPLKESAFLATFDALQKFRADEYTNALQRLEAFCYSSAVDILEGHPRQSNIVAGWFGRDLVRYRSKYANPPADQYPTERKLDALLSPVHRGQTNATFPE